MNGLIQSVESIGLIYQLRNFTWVILLNKDQSMGYSFIPDEAVHGKRLSTLFHQGTPC